MSDPLGALILISGAAWCGAAGAAIIHLLGGQRRRTEAKEVVKDVLEQVFDLGRARQSHAEIERLLAAAARLLQPDAGVPPATGAVAAWLQEPLVARAVTRATRIAPATSGINKTCEAFCRDCAHGAGDGWICTADPDTPQLCVTAITTGSCGPGHTQFTPRPS